MTPSPSPAVLVASGAIAGTLLTLAVLRLHVRWFSPSLAEARDRRRRLPKIIILVRHGESEANADKTIWKEIPDNLVSLTENGRQQALEIGKRVEAILEQEKCARIHLVVSPFERTLQTAGQMRKAFEKRVVRTDIESRIREQEMGNLQGEEFVKYRQEQVRVGRFWYRFPTGEAGTDVIDRVKSWWFESVLPINTRVGYKAIDAIVVVTHGLTMRFVLMQLFGWSPTTFHSVWNAENCDLYVLKKDLTRPGTSPYVLDQDSGDTPRSSIETLVELKSTGEKRILKLENYLSIPPPRTTRIELVKSMLEEQYPLDIVANDIASIVFMPFIEGGRIRGRSTSGVSSARLESDFRCLCSIEKETE